MTRYFETTSHVRVEEEQARMQEIVEQYPGGMFFYECRSGREDEDIVGEIQGRLGKALPQRLVVVSDKEFHYVDIFGEGRRIFPADMGMAVNGGIYAYKQIDSLLGVCSQAVGTSIDVFKSMLPDFDEGKDVYEGGLNIEVAGSDLVYTIDPKLGLVKEERFRYLSGLDNAFAYFYANRMCLSNDERLILGRGHIDLAVTTCWDLDNGIPKFYVYDSLLDELADGRMFGFFDPQLEEAERVPIEYVESGGLNIKYIDDAALVPTREGVFPLLRADLERLGYKIIELGEEEFNLLYGHGIKCNSFDLSWRQGVV